MNILILFSIIAIVILGALCLHFFGLYKKEKSSWKQQEAAMRDQFYEVVHELRAPLTAVKDAASLLNTSSGSLSSDEQTKMLTIIHRECIRLLDHVSGVLDASKVMNNKLTIEKAPNDLKVLLQEKIMIFSAQAKAANLELASDIDPQLPEVMYDPKYMSQVINNLISNSLKYTPTGGTITVSAKNVDNAVTVSVFDNGTGVPDEKQKELFSKFASMNNKNSGVASSGLGLFVVKGIIEAHGGSVSVETHQGRGYKVSFTLPLSSMPASLSQH